MCISTLAEDWHSLYLWQGQLALDYEPVFSAYLRGGITFHRTIVGLHCLVGKFTNKTATVFSADVV